MRVLVALLVSVLILPSGAAAQELPRAHFYSEAGGDSPRPDDGFLVADRPGFGFSTGRNFVRFWSEFQRHGGIAILGYPASRPFVWDGFDVQVFQKSILQWRSEVDQAWSMNVFDEFTRRGLDQRLLAEKQVPLPATFDDSGKSFEQIMQERLALLEAHPAFMRQFQSVPDPLMLYGLPNSTVQDFGPFYAVRLQRAAFQEWKIDAPGIARVGEVTVVNAGDAAKEFGLIPDAARQPVAPPAPASEQVAVYTPGVQDSVDSPFTVAGDARAFEATVLWELTDSQRGDVLGRGFTTAAACCEWNTFEFEVPYAVSGPIAATLAVWGASGRDENERLGEVRVALQLSGVQRPAAAKDGWLLIEPLSVAADGAGLVVTARVRNESSSALRVDEVDFGLRDARGVAWSSGSGLWSIPPGESREVRVVFASISAPDVSVLRLLHQSQRASRPGATPVVLDVPDGRAAQSAPAPVPSGAPTQAVIAEAAKVAGVDPSAVQVLRAEQVEWSDASLGCPQPGMAYAQVLTPGWRVVVRAAGQVFDYHTDLHGRIVLCSQSQPMLGT